MYIYIAAVLIVFGFIVFGHCMFCIYTCELFWGINEVADHGHQQGAGNDPGSLLFPWQRCALEFPTLHESSLHSFVLVQNMMPYW